MRVAKNVIVEYRQCSRSGIVGEWTFLPLANVIDITMRPGANYNTAIIELSDTRWNESCGVQWGYNVRVRHYDTILFQGFVVNFSSGYSSSVAEDPQNPPQSREWVRMQCNDYRWLFNNCCPIYGQVARGYDDYETDGTKKDSATFMSGRRCIFNPDGYFNMDPDAVSFASGWGAYTSAFSVNVFSNPTIGGTPWTVGKAISYLLSPLHNQVPLIAIIPNFLTMPGMGQLDFNTVINHVIVDCQGVVDAVALLCDNIGWTLREEYSSTGAFWVFYKAGFAYGSARVYINEGYNPCLLHTLHAPGSGEDITEAVKTDGKMMVMALDLNEDITPVVNRPCGLSSLARFEFTTELVPAWKDSELHITSGPSDLYIIEADLRAIDNPDSKDYYKYHHASGISFLQDVGRKWALNESGKYSGGDYDRGVCFDFSASGIPTQYLTHNEKRNYGPFNRAFLPCLTYDKDSLNSVGYKLEWSCDGGYSWQELVCPVNILDGESAIRIAIPNLAEIVDKANGKISGGIYDKTEINYFTSLADDKANSRIFKTGGWNTRVRITATIQMDQRWVSMAETVYEGSPFIQTRVYDYSDRYALQKRCSSSVYASSGLPSRDIDDYQKLRGQTELVRMANEDMAIHGRFVLDRLWFDGVNPPDIMLGDSVGGLTGRNYPLYQLLGERLIYPEIVEIQYQIQSQKQILLIRDNRLSIKR
ncbi:MAG TPA: hypothetical protein VLJ10_00425 [Candidatus Bathyarchaeia archaeon]|nr:hypothetical protein [Candidatus Bathyarchaeia archaeon]